MKTNLIARLKEDTRVLCGRHGCGCELARIVTVPGTVYSPTGAALSTSGDIRYVQFSPGWQHDAQGLWALSKGARKSHATDEYLATGNGYTRPKLASDASARLATGKTIAHKRPLPNQYTGELNQARKGAELPAFARCPKCTGIVALEAGPLRAVSKPNG